MKHNKMTEAYKTLEEMSYEQLSSETSYHLSSACENVEQALNGQYSKAVDALSHLQKLGKEDVVVHGESNTLDFQRAKMLLSEATEF